MNKRTKHLYIARYLALDFFSAFIAIVALVLLADIDGKYANLEGWGSAGAPIWLLFLVIGVAGPLFWVTIYKISGNYKNILRSSRLALLGKTFAGTLLGCLILFFVTNSFSFHIIPPAQDYVHDIAFFFALQFSFTGISRSLFATHIIKKFNNRELGFRTLLIGNRLSAANLYKEIISQKKSAGNLFVGYVALNQDVCCNQLAHLPNLGSHHNIPEILKMHEIEEVIIAIKNDEHHHLPLLLAMLSENGTIVKTTPELQDILLGKVKLSSILGTPLALVQPASMPYWQHVTKRTFDMIVALVGMILFAPFYLIISIVIKFTSKGPVLFKQERIGRYGKPFIMHKFRTMYENAEKDGPQLSREGDPRITPLGRFLRKVRVDEIPQLYNVLIGNMSLVGPRPERQYYIDQIMERAPQYKLVLNIKPGITGWGQVKQGYTENVDQMISRLKYDLLYLGNMSLVIDLKIIIHTIWIVIQGRGK